MKPITMEKGQELKCYAGKILRIDLTNRRTEIIPTAKYLPQYVGGRAIANRIFWDEVKEAVPALDPGNKLIFMTGPCAGVGLPFSGRGIMTGIGAKEIPEQYTHSSVGGYFGTMLKWAGYDGFVLEGKASEHTVVHIKDDQVTFENADWLWGSLVHESQNKIFDRYGKDAHALVIGPAGENLHRHASISTGADSALAKPGFGAVFGSKNLKAIAVQGSGSLAPGDLEKVLELRKRPDNPDIYIPRPPVHKETLGITEAATVKTPPHDEGLLSCNQGCTHPCLSTMFDLDDPLGSGEKISMVGKCLDPMGISMAFDCGDPLGAAIHSKAQEKPGVYKWFTPKIVEPDDPHVKYVTQVYLGDKIQLWGPNFDVGSTISWLCNEYGLDKWDMICWYYPWLAMAKKEGLLEDLDFGMEVDVENPAFTRHFIEMMVYRKGELGDIFAEGMGRALRKLGKEKYADAIYHGRSNSETGESLEIPVSWESSWGECSHWQGRGFQGCQKFLWVSYSLTNMIGSRDELNSAHLHNWVEDYLQYKDDPCHSELLIEKTMDNNRRAEMKDSLLLCEYKDPELCYPKLEEEFYQAATGLKHVTQAEIDDAADMGRLIERAIFVRTFGRTRDLEVEMIYPYLTYPDPYGDTVNWDEWNDCVDLFYKASGWDLKTGWPTRETWEKYGLKDVADELEALGKLPAADNSKDYVRKANPFPR